MAPATIARRRRILIAVLLVTAACHRGDDGRVQGVGTIELTESDVASTVAGRVARIRAADGAMVRANDTLAVLVSTTLPSDLSARDARLHEAEATLRDLERGARPDEIARAESDLKAAESAASHAEGEFARMKTLIANGSISRQAYDDASALATQATSRRDAARHALQLMNAGTRPELIAAARARVAEARAAVANGRSVARELTLVAPIDGVVMQHYVEVGELVAAGQPAMTIGDVARPWVRIYVNQVALPALRVGGAAEGRLDGPADRVFRGRIASINTKAEYTPRVALTENERADMMFGVKVEFADSSGALKPGLPITVKLGTAP
jgi:HlyD family secretion protein